VTLCDQVDRARQRLLQAGISAHGARLDAEVLARHVLGWDRATLLSRQRESAPPGFTERYQEALGRRARREPVAFIIGSREFWGLEFEVSPAVLIPRPETELIIEEALAACAGGAPPSRVVDVGTGSGCLTVALAREFPAAHVTSIDVSRAALEVARRNAGRHGVADRIRFVQASLLTALHGPVDLVVSNPPYVPDAAVRVLHAEVRDHEPHVALRGGEDGLDLLRRLVNQAAACLRPDGLLIIEFGAGQEEAVREAVTPAAGLVIVNVRSDLQDIARVMVARRAPSAS
jgi:release factor glutamine methyltransferase